MDVLILGCGAAGNKAVANMVNMGIIPVNDTILVNSTSKDFPKDYEGRKIILSPSDHGCGKERGIALEFAKSAIAAGEFEVSNIEEYATVIVVTSVEGGTGSGASPLIAKYFNKVHTRNVHIIAFTGFEDDIRGLANTIEFCKEIDPNVIVQLISNASFLQEAGGNKLRAEELANREMAKRISVITGQDFIEGSQNIDDTDILKLSNTAGYMAVEKMYFNKALETREDYEKLIKKILYNSHSVKSTNPKRLGVIFNVKEESKDACDFSGTSIKEAFGEPYEYFTQVQYDGLQEYIAYIVSGMRMPTESIEETYQKYLVSSGALDKSMDTFYADVNAMNLLKEDDSFNMIKGPKKSISVSDFLNDN